MLATVAGRVVDVDSFPTLPSIAIEAMRLMEGEHSSFNSVAELLRNDQVLASRILHYANSPYVGAQRKISSISQAISLLGFNTVRSIILSVSVFDCFSGKSSCQSKRLVNFWLHSIGVASTAEILARKLAFTVPEEAYMAGLLHDMGKLVSYIQSPDQFAEVCQELDRQGSYSRQGMLPLDIEKAILRTNHAELGKLIAEHWGLPEVLAKAMWLHHQPVFETITPAEDDLPRLVRFADVLCVCHHVGSSYFFASESYAHEQFHFALENLMLHHHLSPADIDAIMAEVYIRIKELGNILGFWDEEVYRKLVSSANASLGNMSLTLDSNNRELGATNRILAATNEMTRKLHPGLSIEEAAQEVITSARNAFGVHRGLCMVRDPAAACFVGQLYDGEGFVHFKVPAMVDELRVYAHSRSISDLEAEALKRLERTSVECDSGASLESGIVGMGMGSRFLATFFLAARSSHRGKDPILGELVLDFAEATECAGLDLESVAKHFEGFALAAGQGIERLLLHLDLRRQAEEMAEASRKVEESQRQLFNSHRLATVGRLAAGASHEINNPLTIISLNIQLVQRLLSPQPSPGMVDQREKAMADREREAIDQRLKVVAEQVERISKIIQDLMNFARPTQPKFCPSSLKAIADKVLSVVGDRVSMANVSIDNQIGESLPLVWIDPMQIEQVFMNLLINAKQAMPQGGKITLSAMTREDFVEWRVTDTGIGIPKENLSKIFDPFFTTKMEGEGTGLGLAICHAIVEHNGGFMRVHSTTGEGTTFCVGLPVDSGARLQAIKKTLRETQPPAAEVAPENCRILVVDDERVLNEMLQESFKAAGYAVDGAYDGVEGIGLLRYREYHVVLLDIRMPRKDGLEVLRFVKDHFPDIKVVIITGLASKEEIQQTIRLGAFACLKKPFRLDDVFETVRRAIHARAKGRRQR